MEAVKKIIKIILGNKTASLASFSTIAALYLWKCREENEKLHVKLVEKNRTIYELDAELAREHERSRNHHCHSASNDYELIQRDYALRQLNSRLIEREEFCRNLQKEIIPASAVYGFVALQRLEERTAYKIKCIVMALEIIPEFHSRYEALEKELERLQALDVEISGKKKTYEKDFGLSTLKREYKNQERAVLSRLSGAKSSGPCPLEELIQVSPIENTFWNNGSASQKKKLERELSKLRERFPEISENNLRSAMVYAYSHFKRDIFTVTSRRLERMVDLLIYGDEENLDNANSAPAEEPELCSICLEEMSNVDIVSLVCNHVFHPECINPWRQLNNQCPLCRQPM